MKQLGIVVNFILASVFSGYVFSILWGWFIVTTFGLPVLTIPAALGTILVVRYMTLKVDKSDKEKALDFMEWAKPLACLAIGFVIKLFM